MTARRVWCDVCGRALDGADPGVYLVLDGPEITRLVCTRCRPASLGASDPGPAPNYCAACGAHGRIGEAHRPGCDAVPARAPRVPAAVLRALVRASRN